MTPKYSLFIQLFIFLPTRIPKYFSSSFDSSGSKYSWNCSAKSTICKKGNVHVSSLLACIYVKREKCRCESLPAKCTLISFLRQYISRERFVAAALFSLAIITLLQKSWGVASALSFPSAAREPLGIWIYRENSIVAGESVQRKVIYSVWYKGHVSNP